MTAPAVRRDLAPPAAVIDVARCTMGAIDLDPYSTAEVNHVVQAARWLERDSDLFISGGRHWSPLGQKRVLLAIPSGMRASRVLANKLLKEYRGGHIAQAVLWFGSNEALIACPWIWDFPICIPWTRLAPTFWDDELERSVPVNPADWSPIVYLPPAAPSEAFASGLARFHAAAAPYGRVVLDQWSGDGRWRDCYQAATGKPYGSRKREGRG
jgi:hypothetical protein